MKIKNLIATIGMMALLVVNFTLAQTVPVSMGNNGGDSGSSGEISTPDRIPGDVAELEALNWEKVKYISIYGWSSSSINSTTNVKTSVWLDYSGTNGVVDVEEVLGIIKKQQLLLSVLYPSDQITLGCYLYDKDYNDLFNSYSGASINSPKDGVSSNRLDVVLEMSQNTWLNFADVSWFYIVERDENNNPIRYYYPGEYDIRNGQIRFPNYFSKKNGELVVSLKDGTQVAYGLKAGRKINPTTVQVGIGNVSATGTRTFRGNSNVVAYVEVTLDENQRNISPLSQLVVTGDKPVWVFLGAMRAVNQGTEYAFQAQLWMQGQTPANISPIEIDSTHAVAKLLNPGRYWIKYSFPSGWPKLNQFYQPYNPYGDGGGKG